ncbi:hypothetical protein [Legionella tunisiensis]|nr:hypothetical protein [Legionella tunisiensis]
MGAGLVLFLAPEVLSSVHEVMLDFPSFPLYEIGHVVKGDGRVLLL